MTDKGKKYLYDIILANELIEEFTVEVRTFDIYEADKKTQSAVERQLAIGEALNHFRRIESQIPIVNDRQIIAFRNRIIHAYDNLDNSIIWAILNRQYPTS